MSKTNITITKENLDKVLRKIEEITIKGEKPVYFNIVYWDFDEASSCHFTPVVREEKEYWLFIGDYKKILVILLTHPRVKDLEFDEEEGCVKANFDVPEEYWEKDEWEEDIL